MYIKDSEYRNRISTFCKKTISKKYYPHYLYYKLHGLTIKKSKLAGILPISSNYDAENNIITLATEDDLEFMLMQVASTDYHTPIHSGFRIEKFGNGLNNGYTNLLVKRHFNKSKSSYIIETKIASNIEKIIGQNLMERLYFGGNLNILISELSKYSNREEVVHYIEIIDLISKKINHNSKKQKYDQTIINNVKEVNLFLIKCYINKLKNDLENKKITKVQLYEYLKQYIKNLKYLSISNKEKFYVLDDDSINENIDKDVIKCLYKKFL